MKITLFLQIALFPLTSLSYTYKQLYDILVQDLQGNPKKIPAFSRSAFHDVMNWNPAKNQTVGRGCIAVVPMKQNEPLMESINQLKELVQLQLPNHTFSFGDIVSLAGKAALEVALPCIIIKWRPGRKDCEDRKEIEDGPDGKIDRLEQLRPFLTRYNLSVIEMAIVLAGSHGLQDARMKSNGNLPMARKKNSGTLWIRETSGDGWTYFNQSVNPAFRGNGVVRLPIDMLFFPSILHQASSEGGTPFPHEDLEMRNDYEDDVVALGMKTEKQFNERYAALMSRILDMGIGSTSAFATDLFLPCQSTTQS
jgi:hypothetical protein